MHEALLQSHIAQVIPVVQLRSLRYTLHLLVMMSREDVGMNLITFMMPLIF